MLETREQVRPVEFSPLDLLERASGLVLGQRRPPREAEPVVSGTTSSPRSVVDGSLAAALSRPPCLIAFSGGRDSTALLSLAAAVARWEGLQQPIPITLRFAADAATHESDWQEVIVARLGLRDWIRLDLTDELDALGPIATGALLRHGAYWPPLGHLAVPMLELAHGGSLVTGNGGDEFLSPWALRRIARIRRARALPRSGELKFVALFALPARTRASIWRRRRPLHLGWLTPDADAKLQRLWAASSTILHGSWEDHLEWMLDWRCYELSDAILHALAAEADVRLHEPFLDPAFVRALGREAPREGYESRAQALEHLFGDVLPPGVAERPTKASFTSVPWGPAARAFAEAWDGSGVDPALVDVDALRSEWLRPRPDFRSLTPLQSAWLAGRRAA